MGQVVRPELPKHAREQTGFVEGVLRLGQGKHQYLTFELPDNKKELCGYFHIDYRVVFKNAHLIRFPFTKGNRIGEQQRLG